MQNTIDIMQLFNDALKKSKHDGFTPTEEQTKAIIDHVTNAVNDTVSTMVRTDNLHLFQDKPAGAGKTTFLVDVYRTLGQTVKVNADSRQEAEEAVDRMIEDGSIQWDLSQLTDDFETEVCGEVKADGEEYYW